MAAIAGSSLDWSGPSLTPLQSDIRYDLGWPSSSPTHTFYRTPYTLSDEDVDRIVDRIVTQLESRGYDIVAATRAEEV